MKAAARRPDPLSYLSEELDSLKRAGLYRRLRVLEDEQTPRARFDHRVPTVSFTHPAVVPSELATYLDTHGVYSWDGHSYALPVVEHLGIAQDVPNPEGRPLRLLGEGESGSGQAAADPVARRPR